MRKFFRVKNYRWLPVLATGIVCGCATLPPPVQTFQPPEHGEPRGELVKGNYFMARVGVANFGEAPKAMKPSKPEPPVLPAPATEPLAKAAVPSVPAPAKYVGSASVPPDTERKSPGEYDFSVREMPIEPDPYLLAPGEYRETYDVTAFNRGFAPVTVSIAIDQEASSNITANKTFPLNEVLPPNSTDVLMRVRPQIKEQNSYFRTAYSWSIGDYRAHHQCAEHYQVPFAGNVQAYASVNGNAKASAYARHAVIFVVPAGTRVRAARKGTVVQVRKGKVDILHDDLTVATYAHLGKIQNDLAVGKAVSTDDVLGVVGLSADKGEGYVQLVVWCPKPRSLASSENPSRQIGFDLVSFPLRFCSSTSRECRVLTRDQMVSRSQKPLAAKRREVKKAALRD